MQLQSYNSIGQSSLKLDIGQCELTDGTTSIWVKDLDLPEINLTITETLKSLGTMGDGYNYKGNLLGAKGYLWLCADPANVLQPSQGTDNLRLKLFLSQSPTWNQDWKTSAPIRYGNPGVTEWDSSVVNVGPTSLGTSYNTYTHRCRIGYINHYYSSGVAESSYGYVMNNGVYTMSENFLPKTSQGNTNVPSILMGQASALLGTGVTTNGVYTRIQTTNNINLSSNFMNLPYFGSQGTSLACTKVTIGLRYDSGGTAEVGTSWVAVTSYDHANSYHGAGTVGTKPSPLGYGEPAILGLERVTTNKGSCLKTKTSFFDIPIKVDGINYLCYAGTGGDNTIHTRAAWVSGFYLPIGNF
jgi:hypothetical protein